LRRAQPGRQDQRRIRREEIGKAGPLSDVVGKGDEAASSVFHEGVEQFAIHRIRGQDAEITADIDEDGADARRRN